jgi:hypothetical protein
MTEQSYGQAATIRDSDCLKAIQPDGYTACHENLNKAARTADRTKTEHAPQFR